jgi:hypothetical protein
MPRTNPFRYRDPMRATRLRREAARLCGCGEGHVDVMMDDGRLPFVQVGNRRLPTVHGLEVLLGKSIEELEAALHAKPDNDHHTLPPAA